MKIISSNKISKKVFVLLMSLVMCVTMIPQATFAGISGGQNEEVYGNDIAWTNWTSTTSLPSSTSVYADYQLNDNVTLSSTWEVPYKNNWAGKVVRLNLNGKTISIKGEAKASVIRLNETTFELYDTKGGGKITGGYGNSGRDNDCGGGVAVGQLPSSEGPKAETFIMYGGTITGNTAPFAGGGVIVFDHPADQEQSTFIMKDGAITGNQTLTGTGHGAGVQCQGIFTMDGGTISDNEAVNHAGGLYITATGTGTINDGEISGNKAGTTGAGIEVRGETTINACNVSGNRATGNGGGINVSNDGILTINASNTNRVSIDGNEASGGAGLALSGNANATITNTDIRDNKASGSCDGGGILVESTAKAYIKGGTSITQNGDIEEGLNGETLNLGGAGITSSGLLELDGTSSPVTITENYDFAGQLGGVYQSNKSTQSGLSIKGMVVIDSNVNKDNKPANLLYDIKNGNGDGKSVNITGPLKTTAGDSKIGFTLTQGDPVSGIITESTGKLTTGYISQNPEAQLKDFFSLNTLQDDWNMVWGSSTAPGEDETEIWVAAHVHAWEYLANGNIIYGYCTAEPECDHHGDHDHLDKAAKLTLTTPDADYTGSPYAKTNIVDEIEEVTGATHSDVRYKGRGGTMYPESTTPPTLPGAYTASVSLENAIATSDFNISALKPTLVTPPKGKEKLKYDRTAQDLVEQGVVQHGTIMYRVGTTGTYTSELPAKVNADSYDVYWYVKGDEGYEDYTPENPKITVGIAKADLIIKPKPGQAKVYGEKNPDIYTYTPEGLVSGDSIDGFLKRVDGEDAGEYSYNLGTLNAGANYNIALDANAPKFKINPKSLTSTDIKITLDQNKFVYDGLQKAPIVGVTDKGAALDSNSFETSDEVSAITPGKYTLKVNGKRNYTDSVAVTWEIVNGQATLVKAPTIIDNLVYNKTAQDLINPGTASHGTVVYGTEIGGTFTETIPTGKNAASYTIYYYVQGDEHYNSSGSADEPLGSVEAKIDKANLIIKPKPDQTKVYGEKNPIYTYTSEGLCSGDKIAGSLARETGENAGEYSYNLGTLNAGANYNIALDANAPKFKIIPKSLTSTDIKITLDQNKFVYDGLQKAPIVGVTDKGAALDSSSFGTSGKVSAITPGKYTLKVNGVGNYTDSVAVTWEIVNGQATLVKAPTIIDNLVYNKTAQDLINPGTASHGTVVYGTEIGGTFTETIPTGKNATSYTIYYYVQGDEHYNSSGSADEPLGSVKAKIDKADLIIKPKPDQTKVYGEKDPTFTYTAEGLYSGDKITGSLARALGENVGEYSYKLGTLTGGTNYNIELDANAPKFKITPKSLNHKDITGKLSENSFVYNKGSQGPDSLSIKDGSKELRSSDFIIQEDSQWDGVKVGTYKIFVLGTNNYKDTKVLEWKIIPKPLSDRDIELILQPDTFEYNGENQGPDSITVKDGNDVLQGTDYVVDPSSVLKAKETGDYVITVQGTGNYSGSKSAVWHIHGADIEATAKGVDTEYDGQPHHITVNVDKPAEGYKITYSTDGKKYSEKNPEFVNAGNYAVYYRITAPGFNEQKDSVKVNIHSKVLTEDMLEITPEKIKYSGEEQGPTIIVRDGDKELVEGVDYIIDESSHTRATDAGTYEVKVIGIGNYQGSILGQWEITGGKKPVPVPPKPKPVPAPVNHKKKATKAITTGDSNFGILFAGLGLIAGISAFAIRRKTKQK